MCLVTIAGLRELANRAVDLVFDREPTLGRGRLLCIDGPAGSGKTTLAAEVVVLTGAVPLRMDDLYPGWDGLDHVGPAVRGILEPLAEGRQGHYLRYDWRTARHAEENLVDPAPLTVLEGVGSGSAAWSHLITALVWIEAPDELRLARGLARDGQDQLPHWRSWMEAERRLYAADPIRDRADLVADTAS